MIRPSNVTHVVYHSPCYDGFTAAWVAWTAHQDRAEYIPAGYHHGPPKLPEDARVLVVDVSWSREEMIALRDRVEELLVLDHHASAEKNLRGLDFAEFDMDRSGAGMAWDWFFPFKERHPLVDYVEDRDLWRFALEGTREVHAYLTSTPFEFGPWDNVANIAGIDVGAVRRAGTRIMGYRDLRAQEAVGQAHEVAFPHDPRRYMGVCLGTKDLVSEALHKVLDAHPDYDLALSYSRGRDGRWYYSLRGRDGVVDCSEIAAEYGGGGHPGAAGFIRNDPPLYVRR